MAPGVFPVSMSEDLFFFFSVYHAIYLESLQSRELILKLAQLYNIRPEHILDIYIQGPSGIHILVTDDVS